MNVCIYGLWHLGLVTTAGLLKTTNHSIIGLDAFDMSDLNKGIIPFHEPNVGETLLDGLKRKRLSFTTNHSEALRNSDILWVTFDTPLNSYDIPDSDYVKNRILNIIPYVKNNTKIIISSQVTVGFTGTLIDIIKLQYPDKKLYFAYSPENLQLGTALKRFIDPDRIIIGTQPEERSHFKEFFTSISPSLIWISIISAEMTKHAINAYLATSICFSNEIAQICDSVGALSGEVELGMRSDDRIGVKAYVRSGNAYSGGTLARDVQSLITTTYNSDINTPLLYSIPNSNYDHINWIHKIIRNKMKNEMYGKHILVIGLTYKDGTDTLRQSGSIKLCDWLYKQGSVVYAYDSLVASEIPKHINKFTDQLHLLNNFNCIILLKNPYQLIDKSISEKLFKETIIIDPDGYLQPKKNDDKYFSIRRLK
jgi:UDPglucose 6-dehydrogenase